jgi:hypothetical protein
MSASKLLLNAYLLDGFKLDSDGQHFLGLANRMRLFGLHILTGENGRIERTAL